MPISKDFENRLNRVLPDVVEHFGTPFHLYDEKGILEGGKLLFNTFGAMPKYNNYYAVKALPNPEILKLMKDMGMGFDCSSVSELVMARVIGASPDKIMFTSNNTSDEEFAVAMADGGCILNLDDISLIDKVPAPFPELICFRYNPGSRRGGLDSVIGEPEKCKYGVPHEQIVDAYRQSKKRGAKRFGIHTMVVSNERDYKCMIDTVAMLFQVLELIKTELGIEFEFINMGGGLGIPYRPTDKEINLKQMALEIEVLYREFYKKNGYMPALLMENGRWVTGPHGVLVSKCINHKHSYQEFRGLDASCTSSMMRPAVYASAYHKITVYGKSELKEAVNVVGSVCEDCDRFATGRELPEINEGDLVIIHDTGAHCYAMASNYNGKLRPQELMLRSDGRVDLIRRAETLEDLFATLRFNANELNLTDKLAV